MTIKITNNLAQNRLRSQVLNDFITQLFMEFPAGYRLGQIHSNKGCLEISISRILESFDETRSVRGNIEFGILTAKPKKLPPQSKTFFEKFFLPKIVEPELLGQYIASVDVSFNIKNKISEVTYSVFGEEFLSTFVIMAQKINKTYKNINTSIELASSNPSDEKAV